MSPQLKSQIGTILCRGVVPAWVATGAIVKLIEATPKLLPEKTILAFGKELDKNQVLDLYTLLASLIAIEFVCIVVMVLLGKYARTTAIFILSVFCIVLIGEWAKGNLTSCGCLGNIPIPPWAMLIADGSLLLGVLLFKPTHTTAAQPKRWPLPLAIVLSLVGIGISFGRMYSESKPPIVVLPPIVENGGTGPVENGNDNGNGDVKTPVYPDPPVAENVNPNPKPLKALWYTDNMEEWIGKPWRDIEIFQFMTKWPSNLDQGKHYVVFYRRTCDHCEDMFYNDLTDPELAKMVTAIEMPESKNLMRPDHAWPMPETECEHLSLPLGCDWLITSPLTFRIEDGIITCATEGGHSVCMELGEEDH